MANAAFLPHDRFCAVVRDTPLISIDLLVRTPDGGVLLGLRNNAPAKDTWFVPGGVVRKNERLAEAFARICSAELGLERTWTDSEPVGVYEHLYEDNFTGDPSFGTHYVVIARCLELAEAPASPPEQHRSFRVWPIAELLASDDVHRHTKAYFSDAPAS